MHADPRAATAATKSAGSDSAAKQNEATSPSASFGLPGFPGSVVRKNAVAGGEVSRLNNARYDPAADTEETGQLSDQGARWQQAPQTDGE